MKQVRRDGETITRPRFFLYVLLLFMSHKTCFCTGGDTLSAGQNLLVSQTIISQGSIFELGFFKKGTSLNIYLGIWYKNFADRITVWVANRDKPMLDPSSSRLEISEDGNLVLVNNAKTQVWSSNLTSPMPNSTVAVLLDNGNFVLRDGLKPSTIFWQSFDHPTDTWLPGGKLGINKLTGKTQILTSWKNSKDPAPGMFSLGIDPNGSSTQLFIEWNRSRRYWSSGVWNGQIFTLAPEMRSNKIYDYSFVSNVNESYFTYSVYNSSVLSRFKMDLSGQIKELLWLSGVWDWNLFWYQPRQQSKVYAFCGAFGVVNENLSTFCECLQGFEPFSSRDTELNDWSGGCVRKTPLQCENNGSANGKKDWFLKISSMRLPVNSQAFPARSAGMCLLACMKICSCTAYAYNSIRCSLWEGALLNLQPLSDGDNAGQDLYLRLAASELPNTGGKQSKLWVTIAVVVSLTLPVVGFFICCQCRRKLKRKGEKNSSKDLVLFDFSTSIDTTDDEPNTSNNLRKGGMKNVELPLFSFESVSAATDNFSDANKLGEGGFGPVYKGKLQKGQEIAVKRLSKRSGQGLEEFKNETVLIAKLQHTNLVRLLGCCIEPDEKILIYEYMPNKSLDFFLFDPKKREILDWGTRIRIVEGIAQGLLYLHQYSRLRIIHRDLKASNILLDSKMNPKISDFGMARIFGGNESQANTNHIVGTYGYMSPEYAMDGLFSIKSDVFSFGVLLLEIVSGKKNTGFYHSDSLNLLGYAWELWSADRGSDLMDPILGYSSSTSMLLRYINIGLLCVQESPTDRPTMSEVVSMLSNELVALPKPKQPAFSSNRSKIGTYSKMRSTGICSVNDVTISMMEAR